MLFGPLCPNQLYVRAMRLGSLSNSFLLDIHSAPFSTLLLKLFALQPLTVCIQAATHFLRERKLSFNSYVNCICSMFLTSWSLWQYEVSLYTNNNFKYFYQMYMQIPFQGEQVWFLQSIDITKGAHSWNLFNTFLLHFSKAFTSFKVLMPRTAMFQL